MYDVWNELLEFESRDLLEQFFKKFHTSEVNEWKVREVSSNFIQGREYFRSAIDASITVRPLLIYYGIVSLSRGLILTLQPKLREANLKGAHGLNVKNWNEVLISQKFEHIQIEVGNGTFSELIKATENQNYLRVNTDAVNYKTKLKAPEKGYRISFQDVFNFLPDLDKEFRVWTDKSLPSLIYSPKYNLRKVGDKVVISVYNRGADDELINLAFPLEYCGEKTLERFDQQIIIKYQMIDWLPNLTQKWYGGFDLGQICISPVLKDDVRFNSLSAMFTVSYVFGMMARYYPSTWISLGRSQKGDRIFPLVHSSLNFLQKVYPKAILDFLRDPYPQQLGSR